MLYSLCTIYWHVIHSTIHFSYISHSINIFVVFVRGKGILVYKHMHHLYLTFWYTYFDRNICWPMVIGGNQSSFRARNKSRTAIISIHDQPSILSLWNEVDCYVQPAEEDTHFTFVRLCIDIRLAPINSMPTTFSVPTQYDIIFFMYGKCNSVRMIVVCSQLKNLSVSFVICASCMLYVRFTVVWREPPPQYPLNIIYTFLPHCSLLRSGKLVGGIGEVVV